MNKEECLQFAICNYIKKQYPGVIFNSDLSGLRLNKVQAIKVKKIRSSNAWPDMFFPEPRDKYHGLYIELKVDHTTIVKKNGEMTANKHINEQLEMLKELNRRGYMAKFAVGYIMAKEIIDNYLNL